MNIELDDIQTVGLAAVLLVIGILIKRRVYFFQRFAIPAPVIGGFLFALLNLVFHVTDTVNITLSDTLQKFFMVIFFTTVGYGASVKVLRSSGAKVLYFLGVAGVLVVLQSAVAFGLAPVVQIDPALAMMTGSVSMTGGHGISGGISPLVEASGVGGAQTVAYTAATFGLVAGSLMGGPVANRIIQRRGLKPSTEQMEVNQSILEAGPRELQGDRILRAFIVIFISMAIGSAITAGLNVLIAQFTDLAAFPVYLGSMLVAIFLRYLSDRRDPEVKGELVPVQEVKIVGDVSLAVFLSMALMSIKLWELADLALPLIVLLLAQIVLMFLYANFVTFNLMGRNYDAAVLTAGHCGFGLGATPNGVANMDSVTDKFGESKTAFFVLPIVGGFFIYLFIIFLIMACRAFYKIVPNRVGVLHLHHPHSCFLLLVH